MATLLTKIINKAKLNPIAATAFTIAIAAGGFWFNHEIGYAEVQEKFERNFVEISDLNSGLIKSKKIIELWRNTLIKNDSLLKSIDYVSAKTPSELTKEDVTEIAMMMNNCRLSLSDIIVQTSTARFNNKNLSDIFADINTDANCIDSFVKSRLDFLILIFKDRKQAESKKEQYKSTIEGFRRFAEINERLNSIDASYDKVTDLHNSLVRIDREQRRREDFKSKIVVACSAFVGGFAGYWLILLGHVLRRKKKVKSINQNSSQLSIEKNITPS